MNEHSSKLNDDQLSRRLSALTREAPPPESVWQALERQVQPRSRFPWPAAAGAALVALTVTLVFWSMQPISDEQGVPAVAAMPAETSEWPMDAIESAGLLEPWQANQRALDELMLELERSPDHPVLVHFIADARQRQQQLRLLALSRTRSEASNGGQS